MDDEHETSRQSRRGKDEMNFAEFPLAVIGKRPPRDVKTLEFADMTTDRQSGRPIRRKLTVSAADILGLPTAVDDEVLLGCLQLSYARKFASRKVTFTRSEFLDLLGWRKSGHQYKRLTDSLRRWKGTLVISENGFWDKGQQRWVNDSFSLLDRVHLAGRGTEQSGEDDDCYFVWGDFMWRSIEAGNLRTLDFEFIKSLESGVAKRLYRLLGKRFYHSRTATFDLKTLAFQRVGFSQNMHTGQIKQKLGSGHRELEARGFCRARYVRRSLGQWDVVYESLRPTSSQPEAAASERPLVTALAQRGVRRAARLVEQHPAERIEAAIENYDDRKSHGEPITAGWLVDCIKADEPYGFRRGYQSRAERAEARQQQRRQTRQQRARNLQAEAASAAERQRFDAFLTGLSDADRREYVCAALSGPSLRARLFREQRAACRPDEQAATERAAMFAYWLGSQGSLRSRP